MSLTSEQKAKMDELILVILKDQGDLQNIDIRIELKKRGIDLDGRAGPADKALQRLRKKGLITFGHNKWGLANVTKCQACDGKGFVPNESGNNAAA